VAQVDVALAQLNSQDSNSDVRFQCVLPLVSLRQPCACGWTVLPIDPKPATN
jgi:hypothetical protein